MASVEKRTSVRVILIDPRDRVLLLGARNPDDDREVWVMPGGGIEEGESLEDAARRELREELRVADLTFSRPVWTRKHDFKWNGRHISQVEWFLLARVTEALPPDRIHPTRIEGDYFVGANWLSVKEIDQWHATVASRRLSNLLPAVLEGNLPMNPIDTGV